MDVFSLSPKFLQNICPFYPILHFATNIPEKIRLRKDKTNLTPLFDRCIKGKVSSKIRRIQTQSLLAARGYIDQEKLHDTLERYIRGDIRSDGVIWPAIALEVWLEEYDKTGQHL